MDNNKLGTKTIVPKYRYSCHGCTKVAYNAEKPELNKSVMCPHCGMTQLTKLENFIAL